MLYSTTYKSPVGIIKLACNIDNLIGAWNEGQKYHGSGLADKMTAKDDIYIFDLAKEWLDRYFAGEKPGISELPLAPIGSTFRQDVWKILCEIPYGEVTTYGEIAKKMALKMGKERMSCQAVGGAVGHNPISIIIPCHRVVGSNGSLTGYAGGIKMKEKLLKLEGVETSRFFIPQRGTAL